MRKSMKKKIEQASIYTLLFQRFQQIRLSSAKGLRTAAEPLGRKPLEGDLSFV